MTNFKIVPVEPTEEMLRVACDEEQRPLPMWTRMKAIYTATLNEAPVINIVATKNEQGQIISVTLQDEDHRILEVIAESDVKVEAGEGVPDYISDALDNLALDNYELSYAGYLERKADAELIRAHIARTGQPLTHSAKERNHE